MRSYSFSVRRLKLLACALAALAVVLLAGFGYVSYSLWSGTADAKAETPAETGRQAELKELAKEAQNLQSEMEKLTEREKTGRRTSLPSIRGRAGRPCRRKSRRCDVHSMRCHAVCLSGAKAWRSSKRDMRSNGKKQRRVRLKRIRWHGRACREMSLQAGRHRATYRHPSAGVGTARTSIRASTSPTIWGRPSWRRRTAS